MFSSEGHFALFQSKTAIPRIAANDRAKATPEEALAIVASAIAYYGTYSVSEADKTILVKVNASTFANIADGAEQKRIITSLTADELKFTNPRTPAGVTLRTDLEAGASVTWSHRDRLQRGAVYVTPADEAERIVLMR